VPPKNKNSIIYRDNRLKALLWMFIGGMAVLAFALIMNEFSSLPKPEAKKPVTSFQVAPPPPPPPPPPPKPKPPEAKPKATPKAAPPSLGSNLAGVDMGLGGFGMDSSMDDGLLGDTSNVVMTADTVDVAPKPATRTAMEYPKKARELGVEGHVVMNLLIDEEGRVTAVKVLESIPEGTFDDVAQAGIVSWVFKPAMYQGKAVKVWAKQKVRFTLN